METNLNLVPFAIEAVGSKELTRLMFQNNLKYGKAFQYQITHDGKKFQAWYYEKIDVIAKMNSELNKNDSRGRNTTRQR